MRRQVTAALLSWILCGSWLNGDVIYLRNGSVLVVERAWEEGDQVKYQVSSGIQAIPLSSVKRIQGQKGTPADPSRGKAVQPVVIRAQPSSPSGSSSRNASATTPATAREAARSSRFRDSAGYQEALRLQQSTGKPIALYFYVDWCRYCAQLERSILSQPEVKQALDKFLYVSVNPEHGKAEDKLFASFEGTGFPAFLILNKNRIAQEISSAGPPAAFIQACNEAAKATRQ